jgi:hypothetical protein
MIFLPTEMTSGTAGRPICHAPQKEEIDRGIVAVQAVLAQPQSLQHFLLVLPVFTAGHPGTALPLLYPGSLQRI